MAVPGTALKFRDRAVGLVVPLLAPGIGHVLHSRHVAGLLFLTATAAGGGTAVVTQHLTSIFPPVIWLLYLIWHCLLVCLSRPGLHPLPGRLSVQSRVLMVPFIMPLVCTLGLLASGVMVVRVDGDSGMPGVLPGEWVVGRRNLPEPLSPGVLVVVKCNDGAGHRVGRLLALPGERLRQHNGTIWRQSSPLPQQTIGYWQFGETEHLAASEVTEDDFYVVLLNQDGNRGALDSGEVELGDSKAGVVPDNRGSDDFVSCAGSMAVAASEIEGRPGHILFSRRISRLGAPLK